MRRTKVFQRKKESRKIKHRKRRSKKKLEHENEDQINNPRGQQGFYPSDLRTSSRAGSFWPSRESLVAGWLDESRLWLNPWPIRRERSHWPILLLGVHNRVSRARPFSGGRPLHEYPFETAPGIRGLEASTLAFIRSSLPLNLYVACPIARRSPLSRPPWARPNKPHQKP